MKADIIVCGGGLGGFAATLAAARNGYKVILTEETDWIGGQLTQQGVPPDEHPWIETHGAPASYMQFRNQVRAYYKKYYPFSSNPHYRALGFYPLFFLSSLHTFLHLLQRSNMLILPVVRVLYL